MLDSLTQFFLVQPLRDPAGEKTTMCHHGSILDLVFLFEPLFSRPYSSGITKSISYQQLVRHIYLWYMPTKACKEERDFGTEFRKQEARE